MRQRRVAMKCRRLPGVDYLAPCQLPLLLRLSLNLNAARLHAFFEGHRQPQHPVPVGRSKFVEVEELRDGKRLFVARAVAGPCRRPESLPEW